MEKEQVVSKDGMFLDTLKRNNKQIRDDRAKQIYDETKLLYKRTIEDLEMDILGMERERSYMLDINSDDKNKIINPSDFKAAAFVNTDIELGVKIRNAEITRDIAKEQFELLFGKE